MNQSNQVSPDTGDNPGDNMAVTNGGGRELIGGRLILVDEKNGTRTELTDEMIWDSLDKKFVIDSEKFCVGDIKASIRLFREGGFLTRVTPRREYAANINNDINHDESDSDNTIEYVEDEIISETDFENILQYIWETLFQTELDTRHFPVSKLVEWDYRKIVSLTMMPKNCYGEWMTSYHLGRSIELIDQLESLSLMSHDDIPPVLEQGFCTSIPAELSNLEELVDLSWHVGWQDSHEANIQPVRFKKLTGLAFLIFDTCPGLSDWLTESTFDQLLSFCYTSTLDSRYHDSFHLTVQSIAGVTTSAKRLRQIVITDPGQGLLGQLLLRVIPQYTPSLKDLAVVWRVEDSTVVTTDLSAIAKKLQSAEFHEDFESSSAVNLQTLTLFDRSVVNEGPNGYLFKHDGDTAAAIQILSHFKRLTFSSGEHRYEPRKGEDNGLNNRLEYLLHVNHSGVRVLLPSFNTGMRQALQEKNDRSDGAGVGPNIPLSLWPVILESAWKRCKKAPAWKRSTADSATYVYFMLRPYGHDEGRKTCGVGPCLTHVLEEDTVQNPKTDEQ